MSLVTLVVMRRPKLRVACAWAEREVMRSM